MIYRKNLRTQFVWHLLWEGRLINADKWHFPTQYGPINFDANEGRTYFEDEDDAHIRLSEWLESSQRGIMLHVSAVHNMALTDLQFVLVASVCPRILREDNGKERTD